MIEIRIAAEPKHNAVPWDTINALGPHVLWLLFAIALLFWIGRSRLDALLARIEKVNFAGVELQFEQAIVQAAAARGESLPSATINRAARRLAQSSALLVDAKLLWVDDNPDSVLFERALFEKAGAKICLVTSSEQAWQNLNHTNYDLILSDIRRGEDQKAGTDLLQRMVNENRNAPVIFYVGKATKPVPEGAFGITDSPDELVHLVLDALARHRS